MINGLHGFFPCKKFDNSFCIHISELVYMFRFLYNMWQALKLLDSLYKNKLELVKLLDSLNKQN